MPKISSIQKASLAVRVAGQQFSLALGKNRWWNGTVAGTKSLMGSFGHIGHILFLEVTGLFFVVMAFLLGRFILIENAKRAAGHGDPLRFWLAVGMVVVFVWFAITSFWKARRKR